MLGSRRRGILYRGDLDNVVVLRLVLPGRHEALRVLQLDIEDRRHRRDNHPSDAEMRIDGVAEKRRRATRAGESVGTYVLVSTRRRREMRSRLFYRLRSPIIPDSVCVIFRRYAYAREGSGKRARARARTVPARPIGGAVPRQR